MKPGHAPPPRPAGYSGTPLPRKLGIKEGMTAALVSAPPGFAVGPLPPGAKLRRGARGHADLVIWFVGSRAELGWEIRRIVEFAAGAPLWIAWRKKAGPTAAQSDNAPSERTVREAGLSAGLVDSKVCAIDKEWSGLRFTPRRGSVSRRRGAT